MSSSHYAGSLGSSELKDPMDLNTWILNPWAPWIKAFKKQWFLVTCVSDQRLGKAFLLQMSNRAPSAWLTLRTSLQMYAIQSSLKQFPFVFFTRSVTEPAPQYSITNCKTTNAIHLYRSTERVPAETPRADTHSTTVKVWQTTRDLPGCQET